MDEIIAMLQHSSLENKHNFQTVHEGADARDAATDERFDKIEKRQLKYDDKTGARMITLEERLDSLERRQQQAQQQQQQRQQPCGQGAQGLPPRERHVVVCVGWNTDTPADEIMRDIAEFFDTHGFVCERKWVPRPRHHLAKALFATLEQAWHILGTVNWEGHWMRIERAAEENRRRRPVLETTTAIKTLLTDAERPTVQQDAVRGIVWLRGRRIAERQADGTLSIHDDEALTAGEVEANDAAALAHARS